MPIAKCGGLALHPGGGLFALADNAVVRVDLKAGKHQPVVSDLIKPTCLAFDRKGALYVYDAAPDRKVVRVYGPTGKLLRVIGTPGGYKVGPWDPTRLDSIRSIAVDARDHLWTVSWNYWPKRISQWAADGTFLKDFFGNTAYGGGGVLDPWDKSRLFYGNLEFALDWQTGRTRLKSLTWPSGWDAAEVPIRLNGRDYLVTRPGPASVTRPIGIVALYDQGRQKQVAAVGLANFFPSLRTPEVLRKLARRPLEDFQFIWCDRSGDGQVQAAEVDFSPKRIRGLTPFNRDLGVQAGATRYVVKEFLPNGAPVYTEKQFPGLGDAMKGFLSNVYRLDDGTFFRMGKDEQRVRPDGSVLWSYATEGAGGHALNTASPWHPAQVVCEFGWIGHETAHAGDLGEFVALHCNVGSWNLWSADGLLAGPIFRDIRDPRRTSWAMREHHRGLRLDDVTAGQEHFSGYLCRSRADNRYYAVAGHNHASVVEIVGLDKFRRLTGTLDVTPDMIRQAQEWERRAARAKARGRVRVIDAYRRLTPIKLDGSLDDWESIPPVPLFTDEYARIHSIPYRATFRVTFDDRRLYVCYDTQRMGPLRNTGEQWDRLFKTGAAVDLHLGTDPDADPARRTPVAGDCRLLMTYVGDRPTAVLYRPVAPDARKDEAWQVVSPVFRLAFDQVKRLPDVRMARAGGDDRYVLEASIPLKALGLDIAEGTRLKLDWGMLVTDTAVAQVLSRIYWSNQATAITADVPSEAELTPKLWGRWRIAGD